jgi:hypothetical protein
MYKFVKRAEIPAAAPESPVETAAWAAATPKSGTVNSKADPGLKPNPVTRKEMLISGHETFTKKYALIGHNFHAVRTYIQTTKPGFREAVEQLNVQGKL